MREMMSLDMKENKKSELGYIEADKFGYEGNVSSDMKKEKSESGYIEMDKFGYEGKMSLDMRRNLNLDMKQKK